MNEQSEPVQEAVLIERKLFEQVVEGLKYIDDILCERTLCGHFTPEEIRQVTRILLTQLEEKQP